MNPDASNVEGAPAVAVQRVVMPPVGYRMLAEGEYIRNGDIYTRTQGASWHETRSRGKYSERGYWPMARRHNERGQARPDNL
jgi:hypothetical protein